MALIVLTSVSVWFFYSRWDDIYISFQEREKVSVSYFLAALLASLVSIAAPAFTQKYLFSSAEVKTTVGQNISLVLSATALSATLPGGQAMAAGLTYKRSREWGASRSVASWQLIVAGYIAFSTLLMVCGTGLLLGNKNAGGGLSASLILILGVAGILVLNFSKIIYLIKVATLKTAATFNMGERAGKVIQSLEEIEAIRISRTIILVLVVLGLVNWATDMLTLFFIALSVGIKLSVGDVILVFAISKLAGLLQITPGGVGTVDVANTFALSTVARLSAPDAFLVNVLYRLVTTLLFSLIGWSILAFQASGIKNNINLNKSN